MRKGHGSLPSLFVYEMEFAIAVTLTRGDEKPRRALDRWT